jgi:hypothetical protein
MDSADASWEARFYETHFRPDLRVTLTQETLGLRRLPTPLARGWLEIRGFARASHRQRRHLPVGGSRSWRATTVAWMIRRGPFFERGRFTRRLKSPGRLPASETAATWPLSRSAPKRPLWRRKTRATGHFFPRSRLGWLLGRPRAYLSDKGPQGGLWRNQKGHEDPLVGGGKTDRGRRRVVGLKTPRSRPPEDTTTAHQASLEATGTSSTVDTPCPVCGHVLSPALHPPHSTF